MNDTTIMTEFGAIRPNPKNPRTISAAALEKLCESIKRDPEFMRLRPIVVGADGVVLGGNQRFNAVVRLGMSELPAGWVVRADSLTPEQVKRFILVDNAPDGMSGDWDFEALAADYGFDELADIGFNPGDLGAFDAVGKIDQDEAPDIAPDEPKSRRGEAYRLGEHLLMCGDSTNAEDMERLMGGNQAAMCFTDPPYNVAYEGAAGGIANDSMSPAAFAEFLRSAMTRIVAATRGGIYVCMGTKEMPATRAAFAAAGGHWSCDVVWVKDRFVLGHGDYQQQFEPILYGWPSAMGKHYFLCERNEPNVWEAVNGVQAIEDNGRTLIRFMGFEVAVEGRVSGTVRRQKAKTDIWRFDKPMRSTEHPTMKPVALCAQAVKNSAKRGETVLDPFGGSGSTLIACEQLGRRCLMMEIDPRFCDVIRKRWWMLTHGCYDGWEEGTAG